MGTSLAEHTAAGGTRIGESDRPLPLRSHFVELRRRLLVSLATFAAAAAVAYAFYDPILSLLLSPFEGVRDLSPSGDLLYVNAIAEGFLVRLRVSLCGGFVLSLPVHLYNLMRFIFPALSAPQRRILGIGLAASFVLACLSAAYGFSTVIPISVRFLTAPGFIPERVGLLLGFARNVSFLFWIVAAAVLLFQTPVALLLLLALGVLRRKSLAAGSRYVVVGVFVVAAVLSPPDFVSQLVLAVPLVALYFLTLLVARLFRFGEG